MPTFSLSAYQSILRLAADSGFTFCNYEYPPSPEGKSLLLRVDIDFSPSWAVELARVNCDMGINGTFFVQIDSPNYNLSAPAPMDAVTKLNEMGQYVGLHYWERSWRNEGYTVARVKAGFDQLKAAFPFVRPVVAWHNPLPQMIERPGMLAGTGIINAYGPEFFAQGHYLSDSNCRNNLSDFKGALQSLSKGTLVFLFHPLIWVVEGEDMKEIMKKAFLKKCEEIHEGFLNNSVWSSGLGEAVMKGVKKAL